MHVGIAWEGHHVHRRQIDILSHLELLVFPTNSFCFFTSPMWLQDDCKACTKKKSNVGSIPSQYMPCARVQSENASSTFVQFFPSPKIPWKSGHFVGLNHLCLAAFFGCFCHRLEELWGLRSLDHCCMSWYFNIRASFRSSAGCVRTSSYMFHNLRYRSSDKSCAYLYKSSLDTICS